MARSFSGRSESQPQGAKGWLLGMFGSLLFIQNLHLKVCSCINKFTQRCPLAVAGVWPLIWRCDYPFTTATPGSGSVNRPFAWLKYFTHHQCYEAKLQFKEISCRFPSQVTEVCGSQPMVVRLIVNLTGFGRTGRVTVKWETFGWVEPAGSRAKERWTP